MRFIYYSNFLLIVGMALSSCIVNSTTITPTVINTQFPSLTSMPPTSTHLPTQTATLTPPSTLEPEQARTTIKTLLQEPIDCDAPCFWGIKPGQTTLGEAINAFILLGLELKYTNSQGDKKFYSIIYDFESGLRISPLLAIQNNVVENFNIGIIPEKQKKGVPREWLAYSPETLIKRYGMPSKVTFNVDRGEFPSYLIDMYFDTVDLIVDYKSYNLGTNLQICPLTDQIRSARIWIGKNPENPPPPDLVTLEEATSMTMEEFSKLLMGDPGKACFDLKEEMFP